MCVCMYVCGRCGVALDSWMLPLEEDLYERVQGPLLMVNTETFQWKDNIRPMFRLGINQDDQLMDRVLITIRYDHVHIT